MNFELLPLNFELLPPGVLDLSVVGSTIAPFFMPRVLKKASQKVSYTAPALRGRRVKVRIGDSFRKIAVTIPVVTDAEDMRSRGKNPAPDHNFAFPEP